MGLVYVVGYFGASNLGDDLLLVESMKLIQSEITTSEVVIVCHPNQYLATYFPGTTQITPSEFLRCKLGVRDKIIFAGGGQFSNFSQPGFKNLWGFTEFLSILGIRFISWRWLSRVRGFPFLIGVGPARGAGAKLGSKFLRISLEKGSVRDYRSQAFLPNCDVGVDPILATFDPGPQAQLLQGEQGKTIGILLRSWGDPTKVIDFAKNLVNHLTKQGINSSQITFVSFQKNYDNSVYKDEFFDEFNMISWEPDSTSIASFISQLAKLDHLFSMRAHGIFLAARLGTNVTPVIIEPKIFIAAQQVGVNGQFLNLDSNSDDFRKIHLFGSLPDAKYLQGQDNSNPNQRLRSFLRSY